MNAPLLCKRYNSHFKVGFALAAVYFPCLSKWERTAGNRCDWEFAIRNELNLSQQIIKGELASNK